MRVAVREEYAMRVINRLLMLVFLVAVASATQVSAQIASGQKVEKLKGIVAKRDADSFVLGGVTGSNQVTVLLTPTTEVKSHKRGVFKGSKDYGASYILRGLRLEVDGVGNDQGQRSEERRVGKACRSRWSTAH